MRDRPKEMEGERERVKDCRSEEREGRGMAEFRSRRNENALARDRLPVGAIPAEEVRRCCDLAERVLLVDWIEGVLSWPLPLPTFDAELEEPG